ncbi:MAG: hypothetical protein UT34_C0002G0286 [candidate division WS6 bacterium GW2011_GWF2_39_15]|uniref:Putative 3-methyladenine DNA glycosylase n=1 Tax=candidate division WS6 bacterium GW2011_GWF2_39_15 TaxID=1619100 RepID=A0A0G0MNY4_9BACT|nr:MAG: hypothetical protein UT34_C0002G0286 [candidate division WS6 bacterium GW2011_GWF2_39_15]
MTILDKSFYCKDTVKLAQDLLLKIIHFDGKRIAITETEAYHGYEDKGSHAYKGRTARNSVMFDTVGHTYIYLIYGMYNMFNITAYQEGFPGAVLIRGGYDLDSKIYLRGPGIFTKYMKMDRTINNLPLYEQKVIWIEDRKIKPKRINESKRIGISYAQESQDLLWRFFIDETEIYMIN